MVLKENRSKRKETKESRGLENAYEEWRKY